MEAEAFPTRVGWREWHADDEPIRLGVSACLLGAEVRFDGGHKRDRFLTDVLGRWVEWVPLCPEQAVGMGTPRPTVRIVRRPDGDRLVAPSTGEDWTERMDAWSRERVTALQVADLDGFVLKKDSPTCGMERVKTFLANGHGIDKQGVGFFARRLQERWPNLPLEEEGRLHDPVLRETFIERIFCRNRWRQLLERGLDRRRLVEFHTAHKMLLRSHDEAGYQRLGKLVGSAGTLPDAELFARYETELHATLAVRPTPKKHTNVLQHAFGYLKDVLDARDKRAILAAIDDYRRGLVPLVVPLTLLRFELDKHAVEYVRGQLYLEPHPKELMLRNHV